MIVNPNLAVLLALPYIFGIVGSALLATLGLILRRDKRTLPIIETMPFNTVDLRTRYLLGNSIGIPLASMPVSLVITSNIEGTHQTI